MPPPPPLSPGGAPLAEFGERLAAFVIDGLIMGAIIFVLVVPIYFVGLIAIMPNVVTVNGEPNGPQVASFLAAFFGIFIVVLILVFAIQYVYRVEVMLRGNGQTPGKRVMKLRIVPLDPNVPLTRAMAGKRFLIEFGANLISGVGLLDGLWQLWDKPYRQCLHDKWPGTCVIKLNS